MATGLSLQNEQPCNKHLLQKKLPFLFKLCQVDEDARKLLYPQLPMYCTWRKNKWHKRKLGVDALTRVYSVPLSQAKCYYLRLLLHEVLGPKSFQDLRMVIGHVCKTYREACYQQGFLENDEHWDLALTEASVSDSPRELCNVFAIILNMCQLGGPLQLWMKHRKDMAEDLNCAVQRANPDVNIQFSETILMKH
ncbi:uncharacterized protein LOC106877316 [Octopus bimaculoides]|uniref:uncharacterized protein LOC106877316 n=1 Tax=Octopus bimaculoides TaxID=37653 RepID=UPI00071D5DD3|nr:uncharacterized protein LOC106877316 [Octopus bimaculoides]|eukprot:XP_014781669.1 PREDICTED: uncharacterized protein LOC106877316 [Octopus bimaculoides]